MSPDCGHHVVMPPREPDVNPVRLPSAEARALTSGEQAIIEFLIAGPLGRDELRAQAAGARVVATCSCGCPSIWIEAEASAPDASYSEAETPDGRTDHIGLTAYERIGDETAEVTLHVVNGRMFELEVWGHEYGVRPEIDVSKLEPH
jgi:hypothetical protein